MSNIRFTNPEYVYKNYRLPKSSLRSRRVRVVVRSVHFIIGRLESRLFCQAIPEDFKN